MARILVAEDHDVIRELYETLLSGHELHFVESASDAASYMAARPDYDLVIMDLALRRSSGVVAALALRGLGYTGPIIAITGSIVKVDPLLLERAGFVETLIKPAAAKELVRVVQKYVGVTKGEGGDEHGIS